MSTTTKPDTGAIDSEAAEPVSNPVTTAARAPRRIAVRLSTAVTGLVVIAALAGAITFAVLYFSTRGDLSTRDARAADDKHAEQLAMDYATGASTIDYRDTKSWFEKLKAGTAPQIAAKFDASAPQLEQILLPLQWTSKATPIVATVASESGGVYKVNAFLNVGSTSVQTPQGGTTTVAYTLTIDKNSGWKITDVGGGLDGALASK